MEQKNNENIAQKENKEKKPTSIKEKISNKEEGGSALDFFFY